MSHSPVVLRVEHLSKHYRQRQVVNDVSLDVKAGEIVGLLGANGAGKTSCFAMICGILQADKGHVFLKEQVLDGLPLYRRCQMGLSYLPQESSIFRGLSTEENLLAILQYLPLSQKEQKQRLEQFLESYGLTAIRRIQGSQLSGGEKRRLEMARALLRQPDVLLLDEPFAGVDPLAVYDMQQLIESIAQEGVAILLTDHNVRETLKICHRASILHHGYIMSSGTPEAIASDDLAKEKYLGQHFTLS